MSSSLKFTLVAILVIALMGLLYYFNQVPPAGPQPNGGTPTAQLTPEQAAAAVSAFQTSLGALENSHYEEAIPLLKELVTQFPEEGVVHRHMALSYLVGITALTGESEPTKTQRRQQYMQDLHQTLAGLEKFPEEQVPRLLIAARLAQAEDQLQLAMDLLQQAADAVPTEASFPYELFEVAHITGLPDAEARGLQALEAAHKAQPQNLWVLQRLIVRHATARSPHLKQTLLAALDVLPVVQPGILERNRVDVVQLAQEALKAIEADQWPAAIYNCRIVSNMLLAEDASQSDKIQLEKHPLEFVGVNLSENVTDLLTAAANAPAAGPEFLFEETPLPPGWEGAVHDVCVGDFDLNGTDDVCLLREGQITVYGRDTLDGPWTKASELTVPPGFRRVVAADLDADERSAPRDVPSDMPGKILCRKADLDLVLYGDAGVLLLKNERHAETKSRSWEPISVATELKEITAITAGDLDIDGDLDLLMAGQNGVIEQWSNRTGWKFGLRAGSPVEIPSGLVVSQFLLVDLDRDVDLDVLVVAVDGRCGWLENLRHSLLRYRELQADDKPVQAARLALTDWNADATWDLLAGGESSVRILRGVTSGSGHVVFKQEQEFPFGAGQFELADFTNQGRETLLGTLPGAATGMQFRDLSQNQGTKATELAVSADRSVIWDPDQDGDLDVLAIGAQGVTLLENQTPSTGGWFELSLVAKEFDPEGKAVSSRRINHYAIGSTVEVRAGNRYQARVVQGPVVHFGLGDLQQVETLRIVWTNGIPQHHLNPPIRSLLCEEQVLTGSCPYLYTQNETGTHFVTDLLWAAPLGLPGPDGQLVPSRPWEYIKIPGELLSEVDGRYRLHITEELRETGYYDEIRLYAVDHPADVEVHTNEKVGPPQLAEHCVHSAKNLLTPLAALNQHGRDLLPQVATLDDDYARPYDDQIAHGITEPTTVELQLDLSQVAADQPLDVKLFLTGWLHAPDAGVSTAVHESATHGGELPVPQPLSLWVPDAQQQWREAIPFTGFVGGKTKTIVLDVGAVLNREDPRIQLRSSMEFAWDRIAYTLNEPEIETITTDVHLRSADLHYRGFSQITPHLRRGPDHYDYNMVNSTPKYAPMAGRFTRYGDVLSLLDGRDDQLVVQGAGDELTLEFDALPPPPAGWQRDFVIYSVGWDKDAQMTTVYGMSSEPYPFHGMSTYPSLEPAPETPEYLEYLREYQTRRQTGDAYRRALLQ